MDRQVYVRTSTQTNRTQFAVMPLVTMSFILILLLCGLENVAGQKRRGADIAKEAIETLNTMTEVHAENHDEVIDRLFEIIGLLKKGNYCLTTQPTTTTPITTPTTTTTTTTEVPAACPQPTTSSLGGAACDVTTEGGPWTVVQRRTVGDVLFNMTWADYKVGFGNLDGDHWIGNDALNELCPPAQPCQLKIEVTWPDKPNRNSLPTSHPYHLATQPDGIYIALYGRFAVADAADLYRLTAGDFDDTASTAGDWLTPEHDGHAFSTVDADHDTYVDDACSSYRGGAGWWFHACGYSLNGPWGMGGLKGVNWLPVTGAESATASRMLVRPAA